MTELVPNILLDTDSDVKGDAYETIVGAILRGDRGEFFTPRNVCQAGAARAFHTIPESRWSSVDVIDPACGRGGFLISVIDFLKRSFYQKQLDKWCEAEKAENISNGQVRNFCENHLYSIDLNPKLVRAAQMNELMHGNGHRNPFPANSLDYPDFWKSEDVQLRKSDLLFTNPPFGADLKIENTEIFRQYDLGHQWDDTVKKSRLRKSAPPELLFIERSIQFLKPG